MNVLLDLVHESIAKYLNKLSNAYEMWNFLVDTCKENSQVDDMTGTDIARDDLLCNKMSRNEKKIK